MTGQWRIWFNIIFWLSFIWIGEDVIHEHKRKNRMISLFGLIVITAVALYVP